jgi:A/G-specific adenine glycosylase
MKTENNTYTRKNTAGSYRLNEGKRDSFKQKILKWYKKNQRPLPWRRDPTPYRVWISEIMLQQTQVKTAIPYYRRFLKRYPDIPSLARASEESVLALWSGLGYYSRARNILKAAKHIVEFHNGVFPTEYRKVLSLPGIGRYTAGAICSIALNQSLPVVDGNVRRVVTRLCAIRKKKPEKYFWDRMTEWIPEKQASAFNQAMMELGAVICTPAQPLCPQCPVRNYCRARQLDLQEKIPPPKQGRATEAVELVMLVLERKGRILIVRQKGGLIPGMWGLPYAIVSTPKLPLEAANGLNRKFSQGRTAVHYLAAIRHSITHHRITAHVFAGEVEDSISGFRANSRGICWIPEDRQSSRLTSSLFLKAIRMLRKQ